MSNTKTIAKNSGWYGLETLINFVVTLFTSIAIARTLGPTKMGYIIYVIWISAVVNNLGGMGIPATTRKYMAEFLGGGNRGTARFIYRRTLLLQAGMATLATGGLIFWVLGDATPEYRVASVLVVLSIWPLMVNSISAQANVASEELSRNLPASVTSILVFFVAVAATVVFRWGVVGVGASVLITRLVDFLLRFSMTFKRILAWETVSIFPAGLQRRMMTYAWQSVASMIVALIVWDRSEFLLLKHFSSDIRQVSYYSVAFSMGDRLLISAGIFGSATAATIFAQFGRDKSKLPRLAASSFRYLALTSFPLHFIFASLAPSTLLLLYGNQYKGAIMVVTLAPLLCMPKAFIGPMQNLLQSTERQLYIIMATILAGIVDLSVAWWLIPAYGAVGACIGSGAGQAVAVGTIWAVGVHLYKVRLPWLFVAKVALSSVVASLTAHYFAMQLTPLWAMVCGGSASLIVLFLLFYVFRVLEPEDRLRLNILARMLPKPIPGLVDKVLSVLTRGELVRAQLEPVSKKA
jgi:O-antigen/teichoic acid export membrane protein